MAAVVSGQTVITTTEMHSAGEPVRIVDLTRDNPSSRDVGYPAVIPGRTLLEKRRYVRDYLDAYRKFLMWEPRGHRDMYGALIVKPDTCTSGELTTGELTTATAAADDDECGEDASTVADMAVLFMHNEGYSTMCGHAVIALGRYAVDYGLLVDPNRLREPETEVRIQCPCGVVKAYVERSNGKTTGRVRFHSVPAFAFALDLEVDVKGLDPSSLSASRTVKVDVGYGGAFYAIAVDRDLGIDVCNSSTTEIVRAATLVSEAVRSTIKLDHPDSEDLAFLYGTIVTDGSDAFSEQPTHNLTIFADQEVDRAPTGSGVTARIAVQFTRGLIGFGQRRTFVSAANGSRYIGSAVESAKCGEKYNGVIVEVSGTSHYSGTATFTAEDNDELRAGFLLK